MFYAGMWDVAPDRSDVQSSADALWAKNHGMVNTHLDGLAHVGFRGKGFNGHPFEEMVSIEGGATIRSVTQALAVVTRGVFADIVKAKGGRPLQPGESVDELRAVTGEVGPGDALVIRTGGTLAGGIAPDGQGDPHGTWGGLHASCMEFVAERGVALLATDSPGDCFPSPVSECSSPIHVLSLVFIGVHLVHNLDLEEVAKVCAETGRTSFLFSVTALNVPGATGSLVIPIVIL
jgi:kynurenine formamidase